MSTLLGSSPSILGVTIGGAAGAAGADAVARAEIAQILAVPGSTIVPPGQSTWANGQVWTNNTAAAITVPNPATNVNLAAAGLSVDETADAVPQIVTANAFANQGDIIICNNVVPITVVIQAGVNYCWIGRTSQSTANVTVLAASAGVSVAGDPTGAIINQPIGLVAFALSGANYLAIPPSP